MLKSKKTLCLHKKEDYQNKNVDLALDLYQPKKDNLEKRPVIIWVHGGGMYAGSKDASWDPVYRTGTGFLLKKGYVSVSIDYRLNPTWEEAGTFNETMKNAAEDVASAVDWIRANAENIV